MRLSTFIIVCFIAVIQGTFSPRITCQKLSFFTFCPFFFKDVKSTWMRERENILLSSWEVMGKSLILKEVGSSHLVKQIFHCQEDHKSKETF